MTAPIGTKPATKPDTLQTGLIIHVWTVRGTKLYAKVLMVGEYGLVIKWRNTGDVRTIRHRHFDVADHEPLTDDEQALVKWNEEKYQARQAWLEWLAEEEEPVRLRDELR